MSQPGFGVGEEQRGQFRQFDADHGEELGEQNRQFERRGEQIERQDQFGRGGDFESQHPRHGESLERNEGEFRQEPFTGQQGDEFRNQGKDRFDREDTSKSGMEPFL